MILVRKATEKLYSRRLRQRNPGAQKSEAQHQGLVNFKEIDRNFGGNIATVTGEFAKSSADAFEDPHTPKKSKVVAARAAHEWDDDLQV